jgi:hypothetical protein
MTFRTQDLHSFKYNKPWFNPFKATQYRERNSRVLCVLRVGIKVETVQICAILTSMNSSAIVSLTSQKTTGGRFQEVLLV